MKSLALETSSKLSSIAVKAHGQYFVHTENYTKNQAKNALPAIQKLLEKANLTLAELDFIALGKGPGSFTGLRIASSIAQGLAFSNCLPVVLISSLQACAQAYHHLFKKNHVLVGMNAYMKEIYWGVYQLDHHHIMQAIIPDSLCSPEEAFIPKSGKWSGIGDAWEVYSDCLKQRCLPECVETHQYPCGKTVLALAEIEFKKGHAVKADEALPIYLRGEKAWKANP